jgi:hypothetical protein
VSLVSAYTCLQYAATAAAATPPADTTRVQAMQGIGYVCAVLTFLYFCAIVFMRDRIAIAIQVTKEASKALMDMPMMLFFPIIPFVIICCTTW